MIGSRSLPPVPRLERVSPTTANALIACPYRVALRLVNAVPPRAQPFTAVGLTAHRLIEGATKGEFDQPAQDGVVDAVDHAWELEIRERFEQMRDEWAPASPPPPASWPGIALTRSRVRRRVLGIVTARRDSGLSRRDEPATHNYEHDAPGKAWQRHLPQAELRLEDPATGLLGTLDRIEAAPSGLRVVDVKSGVLQADATDAQRRQLLLYAYLVKANVGELPTELAIEDAGGRQHLSPFTAADVTRAVDEVLAAVEAFNQVSDDEDQLMAAAKPDPERCGSCSQRLACDPYWLALRQDWGHGSVQGQIETIAGGDQAATVQLRVASPSDLEGQLAWVTGALSPASHADGLAIVGTESPGGRPIYRARWDSRASWE